MAYHGKVDVLFVAVGIRQWGTFGPDKNTVHMYKKPRPVAKDLLDFAVIQTLLNRGVVYAVKPEKVPDEAPMAAVFRY